MRPTRRLSRPHRPRSLLLWGSRLVAWLLVGTSLFLSLWIVLPAPTRSLLPLGVGAPEISPWLAVLSAIAFVAVWLTRLSGQWAAIALAGSAVALVLSLLPGLQVASASAHIATTMQTELGADYLASVPSELQQQFRSRPYRLRDVFGGIAIRGPVTITRDIVFATPAGVPLTLNTYRPDAAGIHPTLVVIYGGAWQGGSPSSNETFSRYIAAQGYTVVAIDYRHAPQHRFPAQLIDVKTALVYLQAHAAELGVDLTRVALMGRSAGAQLAAIAAYQQPPMLPLRAVINYYGPVNLRVGYERPPVPDPINARAVLRAFLGGSPAQVPDQYRQASPIHYMRPDLPPTLLVYAGRDHVVQAKFGRKLDRQLQALGNQTVWLEVPWSEHAFDLIFNGVGNQLALYYTERFLAWALYASG